MEQEGSNGTKAVNVSTPGVVQAEAAIKQQEAQEQKEAQPQAQAEEQPKPAEKVAPKEDDFSSKFAALSKREKKLKDEQKAMQERYGKYDTLSKAIESKDSLAVLEAAGFTLDDVINGALAKNKTPTVEDKVETIQQRIERLEKERDEERQRAKSLEEQRAVDTFKNKIKDTVLQGGDKYELIKSIGAYDAIYSTIEQYYVENKDRDDLEDSEKILSVEKASELVEAQLLEQIKGSYSKLKSVGKLKDIFGMVSETPKANPDAKQVVASSKTLTNETTTPLSSTPKQKWLSDEESKRQAAQTIKRLLEEQELARRANA